MASVTQIIHRRRLRKTRRTQARTQRQMWLWLLAIAGFALAVIPVAVFAGVIINALNRADKALPEDLKTTIYLDPVIGVTEMYDSSGQTLLFSVQDPLGDQRTWLSLDELPPYVAQATILSEDDDFLTNAGFDLIATAEDIWTNFLDGPIETNPSLTRRLIRNTIAPVGDVVSAQDRELEIALIAEIQRRYSPEEILEWHLNTNYYGNEAYGIEAAAQAYLGKSARNLTLDEAVLLAAIPTAPRYNPVDNETAARDRQADMLRLMLAAGYIVQSEFQEAININTPMRPDAGQKPLVAPDFAMYARRQAETILDSLQLDGAQLVSRGGLRITTTLDLDLYYQSECILRVHLQQLAGNTSGAPTALDGGQCVGASFLPATTITGVAPPDSGVIVIMDPNTGEIKAMVGPGNEADYQPGVALYPFVYLRGFISPPPNNFTAASMLLDIPRPFPGSAEGLIYIPNNVDRQFRGPISLRAAMGAGLLPPVAQVANIVNLNTVIRRTANPMGVNTMPDGLYDLSLLERGGSVSVLDMTYAYTVFASLGQINGLSIEPASQGLRNHDPVAVKRIEDADGEILWEYDEAQVVSNRVPEFVQVEVAYVINDVLADPTTRWETLGRDNILESQQRAAIVNGITSDHADNWTIGYTPHLVTSVHLGREAGGAMSLNGFAIEGAAPVWRAVMDYVQARDGLPNENWQRPPSIVETLVCETSGQSPNGACPTRSEIFLDGGQVPPPDTYWRLVDINTDTNQLATANTPPALRLQRPYFIPPDEARDWWVANSRPLPPEDYDLTSLPNTVSSTIILQPSELEIVGGPVDIRGSMNDDNMDFYQVSYGQGTNPNDWFDITQQETQFIPGTSLGTWDTTGKSGIYVLRLNVVRTDGAIDRDFVQVIVDNIAPSVVLTAGEPGQVFTIPESEIIPLSAEVNDNIRIDRVEFYHNGQFIGTDREAPYGYDHTINRAGTEIFTAVVFDAVGNSSSAEISVEVVRSGG